ncbi:RING-H2 finger protein ATL80-like [Curcuma longa]|uniref:RING-H2 finger protein ATL80-like n=1 Tax=Curcuma longa TaxID=136217 RepID=UPI003D9EF53C
MVVMGFSVALRLAIGAVVLILLFVIVGFLQFCRRARDDHEATAATADAAAGGVDEATLTSCPKVAYSEAAGLETETCAICLAEYEVADVLRRLPACGHVFHVECVDRWLRSHGSCPFCRALLVGSECRNADGTNAGRRRGNWAYVNTGAVAPLPVVQ